MTQNEKTDTEAVFRQALTHVKHMSLSMAAANIIKQKLDACERPADAVAYSEALAILEARIAKGLPKSPMAQAVGWSFAFMVCCACVSVGVWLMFQALRLSGVV